MPQDAFFTTAKGIDPRENRDAAWELFEQMRDPSRGAGVDEYEFCGGQAELLSQVAVHFSEARPPHSFSKEAL